MSKEGKLAIVTVLITFGVWFYFTPYLAVRGMKSAAEEQNAAQLSRYVNFPTLKESLKAGFNAQIASEIVQMKEANPSAALGAAMAVALVNPMVDAFVTPESLAMVMKGENPQPGGENSQMKKFDPDVNMSMSYEGFDHFVVMVKKKNNNDEPIGFVFNREGLFSWKLSALRLPTHQFQQQKITQPSQPQITPEQSAQMLTLEQEVQKKPGNVEAWTQLGNLYFDTDQPSKAISAYNKALVLAPNNADVLTDLGVMYRRAGNPQQAVASLDRALQINAKHETARFNKGVIQLYDLKDQPGAVRSWQELISINPNATTPNGQLVSKLLREIPGANQQK
jgi:tetratricopeptide (TPR) repeat protein